MFLIVSLRACEKLDHFTGSWTVLALTAAYQWTKPGGIRRTKTADQNLSFCTGPRIWAFMYANSTV